LKSYKWFLEKGYIDDQGNPAEKSPPNCCLSRGVECVVVLIPGFLDG
jgi:hypothetical protein